MPNVPAAHFRQLDPEEIEGQVLYMLEVPLNEYRLYARKATRADRGTGEVTIARTGRFRVKKYQLGPGDLVRAANILAGKTLDQLAFAAGEGRAVLATINDEALADRRAFERHERAGAVSRVGSVTGVVLDVDGGPHLT